ncbi:MAG: hypothetical protein JW821_02595 [Deltaproteobacteria bacterium]|nr:hypothetical protein [Deltaproteobacteria bacterium]
MGSRFSLDEIEHILHHLNYRWNLEALALWKGDRIPIKPYRIYADYEEFLSADTLQTIEAGEEGIRRRRLRHALVDHWLQRTLLPYETEMRTWMRGAAAIVHGKKIYLRDVISWCQKGSSFDDRRILQKETTALCKFLKPFAVGYWDVLLQILREEFGFENYIDYCSEKKGFDYPRQYEILKGLLQETDSLYFRCMEDWCRRRFQRSLGDLTRYDAINLLGLAEFDSLFPAKGLRDLTGFFRYWGMDLDTLPGLHLDLGTEEGKTPQALCLLLQIPDEVYVLMKPEGGWIDLETLWHELGHGLSAAYTAPELSVVEREMATSFALSEAYAFLLQDIGLSMPFLRDYLGLEEEIAGRLFYHKTIKDLAVLRRYAAKYITEYEMFLAGDIADGERYAQTMARYTGFIYQAESHLFDLVPELYCLEYVLAMMAAPILEARLREKAGPGWMFSPVAGELLKMWWREGCRYDIGEFLPVMEMEELTGETLLRRWKGILPEG